MSAGQSFIHFRQRGMSSYNGSKDWVALMKRWSASIFLLAIGCRGKPARDDAAPLPDRDPEAACRVERAKLAPLLAKLGLTPTTTPCGTRDHVWYDGPAARDRLLGKPAGPTAAADLVGHWVHTGAGLDDDVDWHLAPDGVLA